MTDLRTAAQQALDWLYDNDILHPTKVSEALRAALAQQDEPVQEPVLVVEKEPDYWSRGHFYQGSKPHIDRTKVWSLPIGTKLYTAPPQRKPVVSVDELANHIRVVDGNHSLGAGALAEKIVEFLIKQAHGIGEQP